MHTLTYLKSRRLWIVRNLQIWGLLCDAQLYYLAVESVESVGRIMFGTSTIGDSLQDVQFSDLIDNKGNQLPSEINSPRVLVRPCTPHTAFIVGEESNTGFRIARDPAAPEPVAVDLFIFETGT